jgi:ribosomal protein S27AE
MAVKASGVPKKCPKCGTMVYAQDGTYRCPKCGYVLPPD